MDVDEVLLDKGLHKLKALVIDMKNNNGTNLEYYYRLTGAIKNLYDAVSKGGNDE